MKILVPISSSLDLTVSALAAVVLHAAVLGFGFGPLERAPMPEINQILRCETVTMSTRKHYTREPVKERIREAVERDRLETTPEAENATRILQRQPARDHSMETRTKKRVSRTVQEVLPRQSREAQVREKAPEPEERSLKPPEPSGEKETAISRVAAPAVKGYDIIYPRFARLHGYEGRVTMAVTVGPDGKVLAVDLLKSSGYDILDRSAVRQMKSIPFLPALDRKGEPIEFRVKLSVNFNFKESASGTLSG
jgi:protein TonB